MRSRKCSEPANRQTGCCSGADLRARLAALGLPHKDFATTLGRSPVTVSQWVCDRIPVPEYAVKMLDVLEAREADKREIERLGGGRRDVARKHTEGGTEKCES